MLRVKIYPLFSHNEPMMWDVYTYLNNRLLLIEKLSTAMAERRRLQVENDRARAEEVSA